MSAVAEMTKNAQRAAALGALIATYETPLERLRVINALHRKGLIKPETADLFVEAMAS